MNEILHLNVAEPNGKIFIREFHLAAKLINRVGLVPTTDRVHLIFIMRINCHIPVCQETLGMACSCIKHQDLRPGRHEKEL